MNLDLRYIFQDFYISLSSLFPLKSFILEYLLFDLVSNVVTVTDGVSRLIWYLENAEGVVARRD